MTVTVATVVPRDNAKNPSRGRELVPPHFGSNQTAYIQGGWEAGLRQLAH